MKTDNEFRIVLALENIDVHLGEVVALQRESLLLAQHALQNQANMIEANAELNDLLHRDPPWETE